MSPESRPSLEEILVMIIPLLPVLLLVPDTKGIVVLAISAFSLLFSVYSIGLNGIKLHQIPVTYAYGIILILAALTLLVEPSIAAYLLPIAILLMGRSTLTILKLDKDLSELDLLAFSLPAGFLIISAISGLKLLVNSDIIAPLSMICLATVYFLMKEPTRPPSFNRRVDALVILLIMLLALLHYISVYPDYLRLYSNDIVIHYNGALSVYKDLQIDSFYGIYHLFLSFFLPFVGYTQLMSGIVLLNLILPLMFYSMTKHLFEGEDSRLPALSTLFMSLSSSLAWLAYLRLYISSPATEPKFLMSMADIKSYNSLIWSNPLFFWGLPLSLAIGILSLGLASLKMGRKDLLVMSIIAIFFIHRPEFLILIASSVLLSLFTDQEVRDSLRYLGVACLILPLIPPLQSMSLIALQEILAITAILASLFPFRKLQIYGSRIIELVLPSLFISGLIVWLLKFDEFSNSTLNLLMKVGQVPWFMYPIMIGFSSLVALLSLKLRPVKNSSYLLSVVFTCLLAGRALTLVKAYGLYTEYWEFRFPLVMMVFLAPLAANLALRIRAASIARAFLIGLIFSASFMTTAMNYERWGHITGNPSAKINENLFNLLTSVNLDLPVVSFTYDSYYETLLMNASGYFMYPFLWTAKSKEAIKSLEGKEVAIYISSRDRKMLQEERPTLLLDCLLDSGELLYSRGGTDIVKLKIPPIDGGGLAMFPFDRYLFNRYMCLQMYLRKYGMAFKGDPVNGDLIIGDIPPLFVEDDLISSRAWSHLPKGWSYENGSLTYLGNSSAPITFPVVMSEGELELQFRGSVGGSLQLIFPSAEGKGYYTATVDMNNLLLRLDIIRGRTSKNLGMWKIEIKEENILRVILGGTTSLLFNDLAIKDVNVTIKPKAIGLVTNSKGLEIISLKIRGLVDQGEKRLGSVIVAEDIGEVGRGLFTMSNRSIYVNAIEGEVSREISRVSSPIISPKEGTNVTAWYVGDNGKIPFIATGIFNGTLVKYVYVGPLVKSGALSILGELFPEERFNTSAQPIAGLAKELILREVNVEAPSVLSQNGLNGTDVRIIASKAIVRPHISPYVRMILVPPVRMEGNFINGSRDFEVLEKNVTVIVREPEVVFKVGEAHGFLECDEEVCSDIGDVKISGKLKLIGNSELVAIIGEPSVKRKLEFYNELPTLPLGIGAFIPSFLLVYLIDRLLQETTKVKTRKRRRKKR